MSPYIERIKTCKYIYFFEFSNFPLFSPNIDRCKDLYVFFVSFHPSSWFINQKHAPQFMDLRFVPCQKM
jgi:hypothetical protein